MNGHIHLDTLKTFFLKQYGIQTELICKKVANKHQYCTIIVEKDSHIALVTFRSNESEFNEDTVILIDRNGQQINNDKILFFTMSDNNLFAYNPHRWCVNEKLIESGQLRLMRNPVTAEELQEIQKLEMKRYPRSTGIILNAEIDGENLTKCMVDKIVYTDNFHFSELLRGRNSDILIEYNKCVYDSYESGRNTILVINKENGDGILIDSQGYDYARYKAYLPQIFYFAEHWLDNEIAAKSKQIFKLYIPIQVDFEQDTQKLEDAGKSEMVSPRDYYFDIKVAIAKNIALNGRHGLARDIKDQDLKAKIYSLIPNIDYINNTVCGTMVARITESLTEDDINRLKEYCTKQLANGFGKHFASQAIAVNDGKIYVRFYTQNYSIKTADEIYEAQQSQNQEIQDPELSM